MSFVARSRCLFCCTAFLASLLMSAAASAEEDDYQMDVVHDGRAVAIERTLPSNPRHRGRPTQEAWVRMSYVVTPDGRAIDPIIINSSGGGVFEKEVIEASKSWTFEPTATNAELPYNVVNSRFTILGRGKGTTRKFARYARHIMKNLHDKKVPIARKHTDEALKIGGWSLYESTILWLMAGRVEGAEGDDVEKLEMYRRGLAVSDPLSLRRDARLDLLEDIFELEVKFGQYAAAMRTYAMVEEVKGSALAEKRLAQQVEEVSQILANEPVLTAAATIANPCDCDDGTPIWNYIPARRTFSFANVDGNVERFEARCEFQRVAGDVEADQQWTLEADWGFCQVFVFGDDGATFDFLEHMPGDNDVADQTAVASSHVLDRRNRSQ